MTTRELWQNIMHYGEFDRMPVVHWAGWPETRERWISEGMPADADERLANLEQLMSRVDKLGIPYGDIFLDNLVLPIGTDPRHGEMFLEATRRSRQRWGADIHLTGGLSNISFGVPQRKLMNEVFTRLFIEAGGDSGIVDPLQIREEKIRALDPASETFRITQEALLGRDEFCMSYLMAAREGRLK